MEGRKVKYATVPKIYNQFHSPDNDNDHCDRVTCRQDFLLSFCGNSGRNPEFYCHIHTSE